MIPPSHGGSRRFKSAPTHSILRRADARSGSRVRRIRTRERGASDRGSNSATIHAPFVHLNSHREPDVHKSCRVVGCESYRSDVPITRVRRILKPGFNARTCRIAVRFLRLSIQSPIAPVPVPGRPAVIDPATIGTRGYGHRPGPVERAPAAVNGRDSQSDDPLLVPGGPVPGRLHSGPRGRIGTDTTIDI